MQIVVLHSYKTQEEQFCLACLKKEYPALFRKITKKSGTLSESSGFCQGCQIPLGRVGVIRCSCGKPAGISHEPVDITLACASCYERLQENTRQSVFALLGNLEQLANREGLAYLEKAVFEAERALRSPDLFGEARIGVREAMLRYASEMNEIELQAFERMLALIDQSYQVRPENIYFLRTGDNRF